MNILGLIACCFKGHDINESENIMADVMLDKRNWLCKCHRCGLYVMHDGAISGQYVAVTEREAYKIKEDFIREMKPLWMLQQTEHTETHDKHTPCVKSNLE